MKFLRRTSHYVATATPIVLLVACASLAQSQTPQSKTASSINQPTTTDSRGTDKSPLVIGTIPTIKIQTDPEQEKQDRKNSADSRRVTKQLAIATLVLAALQLGVIGYQTTIYSRQRAIMADQAQAAKNAVAAAELQRVVLEGQSMTLTNQTKILGDQSSTLGDTLRTNKQIERAYIALSHRDSELVRSPANVAVGISVVIDVRNYGRTPGDILGGFCGFVLQPYKDGPDLRKVFGGPRILTTAFLLPYPEGVVDFGIRLSVPEYMKQISNLDIDDALWIVGVIDYRDRFGRIHRGGYGRVFHRADNNFVYDPSTNPLNYDRPLTKEEIEQHAYEEQSQETDS